MSYFRFYIYMAIRKVLFFTIFSERSYKGLILALNETSMIQNWLPARFIKTVSSEWF